MLHSLCTGEWLLLKMTDIIVQFILLHMLSILFFFALNVKVLIFPNCFFYLENTVYVIFRKVKEWENILNTRLAVPCLIKTIFL